MKIEHLKKFNSFYDKYGKKLVIGSYGIAAIIWLISVIFDAIMRKK